MAGKEIVISNLNNKLLKKTVLEVGDNSIILLENTECKLEISDIVFKKEANTCDEEIKKSVLLSNKFKNKWFIGLSTSYIDSDLDRCIQNMYLNEKSKIDITYFNKNNEVALNIVCVIKIISASDMELFCDWSCSKKLAYVKQQKVLGIGLVKQIRLIEGFHKFSKALKVLLSLDETEDLKNAEESLLNEIKQLKIDLYNNMAFCQLQYNEFEAAVSLSNKVLEFDKNNCKALYRRGCGLMGLDDMEAAYGDICQVLALDPNNSAARSKATVLREKVKSINEKYKKVIKSMFV